MDSSSSSGQGRSSAYGNYEIKIRGQDVPTYLNGVSVEIWKDGCYINSGTVGGFIEVGDKVVALTVAHAFYPREPSLLIRPLYQESDLSTFMNGGTSSTNGYNNVDRFYRNDRRQVAQSRYHTRSHRIPNTSATAASLQATIPMSAHRTVIGDVWALSTIYEKDTEALDWALLDITHPAIRKENNASLWRATLPVSEPEYAHAIVTASATITTNFGSCATLRALSGTCRQPVVVTSDKHSTPSDAGAWAIMIYNEQVLGMLVGTCRSEKKSYLLSMHQILSDIYKQIGRVAKILPMSSEPDPFSQFSFSQFLQSEGSQWS
ncbi:hypothetical protein F5Y07DRAFT_406301 [Xylaria sp. FL0933]|nr:hypothetical protein F5Y07DRAFT_406301 [Xylaria sp. FL0933]